MATYMNIDYVEMENFSYKIHPLLLYNISDHATRYSRLCKEKSSDGVFGVVLGTKNEMVIELRTSFEFNVKVKKDVIDVDIELLMSRLEQFKVVMPQNEILGWYSAKLNSVGLLKIETIVGESLVKVLGQVISVLFVFDYLSLSSNSFSPKGALPLTFYKSFNPSGSRNFMLSQFSPLKATMATTASEQVVISSLSEDDNSNVAALLEIKKNGVCFESLRSRMEITIRWLNSVIENEKPVDHALLRDIAGIVWNLKGINNEALLEYFKRDLETSAYISALTPMTTFFNQYITYNVSNNFNNFVTDQEKTATVVLKGLSSSKKPDELSDLQSSSILINRMS